MSFNAIVKQSKHTNNGKLKLDAVLQGKQGILTTAKQVDEERLVFNICGEKFEVLRSTVERYPNTLLGDETKRKRFWDEKRQEYYLDRNRACFESVLTYYQSNGILIRAHIVPDVLFLRELEFYELGDEVLQKVKGKDETEGEKKQREEKPMAAMPTRKLQRQVWNIFEYPETSNAARCIAWLSCSVVLLSIVLFCIETLPQFREQDASGKTKNHDVFFVIEAACIAWFTFEYLTRLVSSPNKLKFLKEVLNVIDLVAILPFFISFALNSNDSNVSSMAILRAVRLVRVFRIFKLSRYSMGLRILGMTLRASLGELGLLVFFLGVGVVLFGSAIYYAEINVEDGVFYSIPHSFWWAIVTMTTVGYGDMYPTTFLGKLIGSVCACTGILAIALPVPVIVANFERFYSKSQEQAKENSKEKQKKAAKYKALKGFFDRLKRHGMQENREKRNDEYFDMGVCVGEKKKLNVTSKVPSHDILLIDKNGNGTDTTVV